MNYGLSPSHYLSTSGLSWDVMLKMTKIKLTLITDLDMYIFFEKVMRGTISYISSRYSKTRIKTRILYTQMRIIYMVKQYLNLFQQVDSNG